MIKVISESHKRVINVIDDIKCCCEIEDDFHQWSDVAASSIQSFLDDLSPEQTRKVILISTITMKGE